MSNDNFDRDVIKNAPKDVRDDLNADPITGEPGAHPVGTGIGAAGGAAAGAAVGAAGGPVGAAVGGVVGAVVGGLAGKGVGEAVNPTEEAAFWRDNAVETPYYSDARTTYSDLDYDRDYDAAYRVGYENRGAYDANTRFEDVESDLKVKWEQAKFAVRDAWNRVTR